MPNRLREYHRPQDIQSAQELLRRSDVTITPLALGPRLAAARRAQLDKEPARGPVERQPKPDQRALEAGTAVSAPALLCRTARIARHVRARAGPRSLAGLGEAPKARSPQEQLVAAEELFGRGGARIGARREKGRGRGTRRAPCRAPRPPQPREAQPPCPGLLFGPRP